MHLARAIANVLIFREDNPVEFSGSLEPDFVGSILRETVIMDYDGSANFAEGGSNLQSSEGTVQEEDCRLRQLRQPVRSGLLLGCRGICGHSRGLAPRLTHQPCIFQRR